MSKKLSQKDQVNIFVVLQGTSMSSSWDRFTAFVIGVPNHRIDDRSLIQYFYNGQDENNKALLYTTAGVSYSECTYVEIVEKLENISRNNKGWSTRKFDIGRNTIVVQATNNPSVNEMHEELAQVRT